MSTQASTDPSARLSQARSQVESFRFSDERLSEIRDTLKRSRAHHIELEVLTPDLFLDTHFDGEVVTLQGQRYRHRSYQVWCDLAQSLGYSLLTPLVLPAPSCCIKLKFRSISQTLGVSGTSCREVSR